MKNLFLNLIVLLFSSTCFALDCTIQSDLNGDGNYNNLILRVPNVVNQEMVFVFKDGSTYRKNSEALLEEKFFSVNIEKGLNNMEGSRLIVFGTENSNIIVSARHVTGTQSDFESLSATAFDHGSSFGILVDYQNNFHITCLK